MPSEHFQNTEGANKNRQSRETGDNWYARHMARTNEAGS